MKKKALIVDAEPSTRDALIKTLSQFYDVVSASDGEEAVEVYERERPDLILTDLNLPNMTAFDLRRVLQERHRDMIPMMFMSSGANEEQEIRSLKDGAFDYIRKPFRDDALLWRVGNIMRHIDRVQRLQRAADTDPMTGLYNKSYTRHVLTDLCGHTTGMLMMIDLDNFKLVNDLYGHAMGDRVLIRFAEILKSLIRASDIAGRMGGDEFLIYCQDLRGESAVAEKTEALNEQILASAREYMGEDMRIPLGASVGAVAVPDEGTDFAELYQKADETLYRVKRKGKHGYLMFHSGKTHLDGLLSQEARTLNRFCRILEERNRQPGAYKVSFDAFQTLFRYLYRSAEDYRRPIHLALFTLTPYPHGRRKGKLPPDAADHFGQTLGASLRRSDAYTQGDNGQFLVIFTDSDGENEQAIINRILRNWDRSGYADSVLLSYETHVVRP